MLVSKDDEPRPKEPRLFTNPEASTPEDCWLIDPGVVGVVRDGPNGPSLGKCGKKAPPGLWPFADAFPRAALLTREGEGLGLYERRSAKLLTPLSPFRPCW